MAAHMTQEQQRTAFRLRSEGLSISEVARAVGMHFQTVSWVLKGKLTKEGHPASWSPAPGHLTLADREEITIGLSRGERFTTIANRFDQCGSTVSREVAANGGRDGYRAWSGQLRAEQRSRRPKPSKFDSCPRLRGQVEEWLSQWWSPVEIAARLRQEFPDDPMMQVSH